MSSATVLCVWVGVNAKGRVAEKLELGELALPPIEGACLFVHNTDVDVPAKKPHRFLDALARRDGRGVQIAALQ